MPCLRLELAGGVRAIVCTDGRRGRAQLCEDCGSRLGEILCDFPLFDPKRGSPGTCDRRICARCAVRIGPDRHLCRFHAHEEERLASELGGC